MESNRRKKVIKNIKVWKSIVNYIKEYCLISTIHGLNHLARTPHLLEKCVWIFLFCLSIYYVWLFSFMTLNRYNNNPTVISLERDKFSWTTSLPAVTICPINNLNETALEEYLDSKPFINRTKTGEFLKTLFYSNYTSFDQILDNDEIDAKDYISIIDKLHFRVKPEITISGQSLDSSQWLFKTITEMGICYCFNSQLAAYNSLDYWNRKRWDILPTKQTFEVHPLDGEVFANIVNISTGFNVYIHGPYEVADARSRPIFVGDTYYSQIYLSALTIISSEDARKLRVAQRKCRYYYESNLLHSPVYTYVLCRMECRIQLAIKLCDCVPHFYRKIDHEKTCNVNGLHCLSRYKDKLTFLENLENECKCTANCEEVNYVVEEMDFREWFLGTNLQYGIRNFPEIRFKRDVIFRFADVLVYIGSVIGLFLGSSVLTIIELIYYFTLRLFWFIVNNKKQTILLSTY